MRSSFDAGMIQASFANIVQECLKPAQKLRLWIRSHSLVWWQMIRNGLGYVQCVNFLHQSRDVFYNQNDFNDLNVSFSNSFTTTERTTLNFHTCLKYSLSVYFFNRTGVCLMYEQRKLPCQQHERLQKQLQLRDQEWKSARMTHNTKRDLLECWQAAKITRSIFLHSSDTIKV